MSDLTELPSKKPKKSSQISDHVFDPEFQKSFQHCWKFLEPSDLKNAEVIFKPFKVCKINNFLSDDKFLDEVIQDLSFVKTKRNSVDLYQFDQSMDLVEADQESIKLLYESFRIEMVDWMERNTDLKLNGKISMSSSSYSDTDYLLCHDDKFSDTKLGDRKIAFILYFAKDWTAADGGSLDLFDTDELGQPQNVVKSLVPEFNSLVFFEVADNSYHQVAEVLTSQKRRLTISGWFYGENEPKIVLNKPKLEIGYLAPCQVEQSLENWISNSYLKFPIKREIQKQVERESYIFLSNFLKPEIQDELSRDLALGSVQWMKVGPANVRNYEIAQESSLSKALSEFLNLLRSVTFFKLLKDYTELDLEKLDESMNPRMSLELQRWSRGCYTLINNMDENTDIYGSKVHNLSDEPDGDDEEADGGGPGSLDIILQFHTESIVNYDITIDYVDSLQEDCALIHVPAKENHLCLVYKNHNHIRLQKYVNHHCEKYFYNLVCTYYE